MADRLESAGASRNQSVGRIDPGDFAPFRDFLVKRVGLAPDKVATIAKTPSTKFYAAGTIVWIDEFDMAQRSRTS